LTQGGTGRARGGAAGQGAPAGVTPGQASAVAELGDGVRITADPPTNSLIIQATAEAFNTISEVIQALDIRRPQVMVEALILEVDVTDGENLGAGLLYTSTMGADDGRALIIGAENPPSGDNEVNVVRPPIDPNTFTTAILGKTVTIIDVTGDGIPDPTPVISGILQASRRDSDTNILSAPVLLTADNEEAEIVVGQNIPVPTSRLQTADPGGGGDFQTSQNITRQDVGVTLRVTPQISEGDTVRLQIFQEISEVISEDSELGPTTTNRQVENTVFVRDGETVMIGGILSESENRSVTKVPWLGDIPIVGWLFKSRGISVRKVNLFIILTPHIVRDPQDLNRLTVERRERFRDAAGDAMNLTEEELEARRKAVAAGVPLPIDTNPVRREIDLHAGRYPTEKLPQMRSQQEERERARMREIEALKAAERTGNYVVQVASFSDEAEAIDQLKNLLEAGYDGTLLSRTERNRPVHYVQLGPYTDEPRAQHVAREVNATYGLHAVVLVLP
jgi:general secretion pathway protein D